MTLQQVAIDNTKLQRCPARGSSMHTVQGGTDCCQRREAQVGGRPQGSHRGQKVNVRQQAEQELRGAEDEYPPGQPQAARSTAA